MWDHYKHSHEDRKVLVLSSGEYHEYLNEKSKLQRIPVEFFKDFQVQKLSYALISLIYYFIYLFMQYWLSNSMVSPNIKYTKHEYELHTVFVLKDSKFSELAI